MVDDNHPSLDDFDERLKRLKADVAPPERKPVAAEPTTGLGMALAMATHLVAGVGVGAFGGYLLDRWLGTAPVLLIVLLFCGAAGGMLNIYRTATRQGMALGYRPAGRSGGEGTEPAAPDRTGDNQSGTAQRAPSPEKNGDGN